jgi:hypothetical protein
VGTVLMVAFQARMVAFQALSVLDVACASIVSGLIGLEPVLKLVGVFRVIFTPQ